ncbi:hypothetical protein QD712_41665 [Streptomyces acidiscabies]
MQQLGATLGVAVLGRVYLDGTFELAFLAGALVIGVSAVGVWGMGSAARA